MQAQKENPRKFEFYLRELDNHLLVESSAGGVLIRASRDNCSERRKAFFLREISAEGYIPDGYQADAALQTAPSVEWVIDESWKRRSAPGRSGTRFMVRALVYGVILWLELMTLVLVSAG